jgi:hypothetical protein
VEPFIVNAGVVKIHTNSPRYGQTTRERGCTRLLASRCTSYKNVTFSEGTISKAGLLPDAKRLRLQHLLEGAAAGQMNGPGLALDLE